jgi:hypothetical protein
VQAAATQVERAWLNLKRTSVRAPVSGYVARRAAQLGDRIASGAPLMSLVPLERLRVEANFKEVQLTRMRIGQPVTVVADLYGGSVEYHGTVAGVGLGTGAAFALLPAQNATGNWIRWCSACRCASAGPAGTEGAPAAHRTINARQRYTASTPRAGTRAAGRGSVLTRTCTRSTAAISRHASPRSSARTPPGDGAGG